MLRVFTNIESIKKKWGEVKLPDFLQIDFLQGYYKNHNQIKHLFAMDANMRLYAHIFKLTFTQTKNYLKSRSVGTILLSFISFNVLYLTNSYITNVPAYICDKTINLKQLLNAIKHNYSLIVIPDFLFANMIVEDDSYTKIEVEEEMVLDIRSEWNSLADYISDLKKKYRNKVKIIIKETSDLEIRSLDVDDLVVYANDIENLFSQVATSSRFKGPEFNTASFSLFVKQDFMKVDGYFLNEKLVGFSSDFQKEKMKYSYFVGFDKNINQSIPIYGRILLENIASAINLRKERLILGRTANEYKSNFGAVPNKSYVYLKVENKLLRTILRPIYSRLRINSWIKRSPFKIKSSLN